MNLTLNAGDHPLYNATLMLQFPQPVTIRCGEVWLLTGENGLGKSSFMRELLLPLARRTPQLAVCWFDQDAHLQSEAIRARAAALGTPVPKDEGEAMAALLADFAGAEQPVLYLFDEAEMYTALPRSAALARKHALVCISHSEQTLTTFAGAHRLCFSAADRPGHTRVEEIVEERRG